MTSIHRGHRVPAFSKGLPMGPRHLNRNESKVRVQGLDDWEDDLLRRYPDADAISDTAGLPKHQEAFRNYGEGVRPTVREFYRLNHRYQTVSFVKRKREQYLGGGRKRMGVWEAMEFLNQLVDDSDPDTSLSQIQHLLQRPKRSGRMNTHVGLSSQA